MTTPETGEAGAAAAEPATGAPPREDEIPTAPRPPAAPTRPVKDERQAIRRRGPLEIASLGFGWVFVVLFYGSLLWVAAYRVLPPPGSLLMLERRLAGAELSREWTRIEDISPHLVRAVIAAEDSRFCRHNGLDFEAIDDALAERKKGARRRGASTITQQTAKNAFLWNGGGWARKAAEAWFALVVETLWPKRRIMEVYLNLAEWGEGDFGAGAAARARFSTRAADLTREEASLLAAVLPSPNKWSASKPGPYVRGRAATIRKRMEIVRREGLDACVLRSAGA